MSSIVDDLRIEAEIPPKAQRPGAAVVVTLRFVNHGTRPRTLFLARDESYRFGQSTFQLYVGTGAPLVQPPRRDGYVPTAADFHRLGPRSQLEFTQTLRLPRDIAPGRYKVEWVYENELDCWPGSLSVGPSGGPSDGTTIADLWVGRIVDPFTVEVERPVILPRSSA